MSEHVGFAFVVCVVGIGIFFTAPLTGVVFALVYGGVTCVLGLILLWMALS